MAYKVKASTDDSVTVSCGCRNRKDVTIPVWRLQAAASENHDPMKFADACGIPRGHNRSKVLGVAMSWAVEAGHVEAVPAGWVMT